MCDEIYFSVICLYCYFSVSFSKVISFIIIQVQISSWFDDANDRVLLDLIPYFEKLATQPNVVDFLKNNIPPTPYAAIGTIGLPPGLFTQATFPATTSTGSGKSHDTSSIISNIRRPNVSSPLPVSIGDNHPQVSKESSTTLTVSISAENKTQYLTITDAVAVVTKLDPPEVSGPSLNPVLKNNEKSSFSAPLPLTPYVPVTSSSSSVSTTKTLTNNSVQTVASVSNVFTSDEITQPQTSASPGISSSPLTNKLAHIPSTKYSVQSLSMGHKTLLGTYQKKQNPSNKLFGTVSNCFKPTPHIQSIENHHSSSPNKLITPILLPNVTSSTSSGSSTVNVTHSSTSDFTPKINHSIKNQ